MKRKTNWLVLCVILLLALQAYVFGRASTALAQDPGTPAITMEKVLPAEYNGDVRNLPPVPSKPKLEFDLQAPAGHKPTGVGPLLPELPNLPLAPMPSPIQNFAGMNFTQTVTGGRAGAGWPPDTNGDVGKTHYIQAVNDAYAIYNKTGTLLAAFTENSLFATAGNNPCGNGNNFGDPIVLYDQFSDRWILTNFAFALDIFGNPVSPFYQCFAASKSNDPVAGGWWLYALRLDPGGVGKPPVNTINDYAKFGIWNDGCFYMGANGFLMPAGTYNGAEFALFNKSNMEAGAALNWALGFIATTTDPFTLVPSNISGAIAAAKLPPSGTPNYFVSESQAAFAFEVRKFAPGANCASGTLGAATNVSQTSYNIPINGYGPYVPQPNTSNLLDAIDDRIMQKVQYRKVGSAESLWVTHNVRTTITANMAMQWAQVNVTGGTIVGAPVQQQIYAPDATLNRWMGSIAADVQGNVALGYSTSNGQSPNFPSIKYSGRLAGDALGNLPQTEVALILGNGSQTNNCGGAPCHRWGDYSAMSVDPVDDCTFWYTNEYYDTQTNGTIGNWQTRIGSFKFPNCSNPTAVQVDSFDASASATTADQSTFASGLLALLSASALAALGTLWLRRIRRRV